MREIKRKLPLWDIIGREPAPPLTSWPEFRVRIPPAQETELSRKIRLWNRQFVHNSLDRDKEFKELEAKADRYQPVGGFWEPSPVYSKDVLKAAVSAVLKTLGG